MHVSQLTSKNPSPLSSGIKPAHWVDRLGTSFQNPWESYVHYSLKGLLSFFTQRALAPNPTNKELQQITVRKPDWGEEQSTKSTETGAHEKIRATWLGHACFLIEFPPRNKTTPEDRGVRILFDPVFSDRCGPSQYMGPKRYTPAPCPMEDLPDIDAVVISHNHYDHLDTHTIQTLSQRKRTPHFFAPLGNSSYFSNLGIPPSNIHIMDWWDSKRLEVEMPLQDNKNAPEKKRVVDITCTPCQHFTGRTLWDNFKTLWASWVVEEVHDDGSKPLEPNARLPVKVYFAGDTAYRTVPEGKDEDQVPVCPAFEEIGKTFGGFDLAMIPIGAYLPRQFTSNVHCAPQDSVRLFKDIRAKKAIGMHWGTWILTAEGILDPPKRLAEERKKLNIEDDAFITCDIGETLFY